MKLNIKTIIRGRKLFEVKEPPMGSGLNRRHGRSTEIVTCPFCNGNTEVYVWSFAGSGKNCDCGAKLGVWCSLKEIGT